MNDLRFAFRQLLKNPGFTALFMLLTSGAATVVAEQAVANGASTQLPPEVREQLEKQKAAMRAIYLEFTTTNRGTLTNWNYARHRLFPPISKGATSIGTNE